MVCLLQEAKLMFPGTETHKDRCSQDAIPSQLGVLHFGYQFGCTHVVLRLSVAEVC